MNLNQVISVISTSTLTVLATIVGIQLILTLKDLRTTLDRFNQTLDTADIALQKMTQPAVGLFTLLEGLKQSGKIVETISSFIGHRKTTPPVNVDEAE